MGVLRVWKASLPFSPNTDIARRTQADSPATAPDLLQVGWHSLFLRLFPSHQKHVLFQVVLVLSFLIAASYYGMALPTPGLGY